MADELIYQNTPVDLISKKAGVVLVEVSTSAALSSQPCRDVIIKVKAGSSIWVNFDTTAAATTSFPLVANSALNMAELGPLPIANLSMVNLFSAAAVTVFVLWRQ